MNVQRGRFGGQPPIKRLTVPQLTAGERSVVASQRRTFNNAHAYHINSISTCSDGQTFLSADDLRINIWDFERPKSSFSASAVRTPPCASQVCALRPAVPAQTLWT